MNYLRIYNSIVDRAKSRELDCYTETHHVVPKCLGGTDDPENLVRLTAGEHYVCHQLLTKIYPDHSGLVFAAIKMTFGQNRINNKMYGWLKTRYSEYMRGPNNPQRANPRCGERHHYFNKHRGDHYSDEGRKKQSDRMKAKNPMHGMKPWNHGKATEYTRSVWYDADVLYSLWIKSNKPSYCKLYTLHHGRPLNGEPGKIAPYVNVCKYFRNGWIPTEDKEWIQLKEQNV